MQLLRPKFQFIFGLFSCKALNSSIKAIFSDKKMELSQVDVPTYKVILVGNSGVGKTSIVNIFAKIESTSNSPTIGACHYAVARNNVKLNIWDTAGQDQYRTVLPLYFRNASIAICVFDITSKASFSQMDMWLGLLGEHAPTTCKTVIVGNKADLEDKREVWQEDGQILVEKSNSLFYIETSTVKGQNIDELFDSIIKNSDLVPQPRQNSADLSGNGSGGIEQNNPHEDDNSSCC
ncbi:Ras-related protein RABF1 [Tritrichomonas foetus]|uniref:Ras-related protein RABF1 n=1 Tax=Tritrichomonas foetus TaxID=1144522 RepID=A0A1J4J1U3_9EUKA|nr:Ras-related protein RABF1 [Tritrichomonas foetus]|eukprot:OHS93480.1 Ras-related protein RABF1 [Tritrichomonas foetus]